MDFKKLLIAAWQNTINFIGPLLLVTFVQLVVIIGSLGILAPVTTAGYIQALLRTMREQRPPEVRDLFAYMSLFPQLTLVFFCAFVVIAIGFMLLIVPGFIVACAIAFATLYMLPLMTDQGIGTVAAIRKSWQLAMQQPVNDQIIVVIMFVAICSLGGYVPFAFLVTQPMATFILLGAYQERGAALPGDNREQGYREQRGGTPPPPPSPDMPDQ